MATRSLRTRLLRTAVIFAVGGSAFQMSGCDPEVRTTLLQGLQSTATSLSTAFISAYFQGLQDDNTTSGTGLTTTGGGTTP